MDVPPLPGPAPADGTFAVDFHAHVGGEYNRDLDGFGRLVVRAEEPRFVFFGHLRGRFGHGREEIEFPLRTEQIWNVDVDEKGVEFRTTAGKSGTMKKPFVFGCASEDDAKA